MADDPLDFGVDLDDVCKRVEALGYFLSVSDILAAGEALDDTVPASPPAAFVAVSDERADPNKLIGGHAQRVNVSLAVLFVESSSRFDRAAKHQLERTRKALTRQLVAWKPRNAETALEYQRFRVVRIEDGLVWGEVTFGTTYRLSLT